MVSASPQGSEPERRSHVWKVFRELHDGHPCSKTIVLANEKPPATDAGGYHPLLNFPTIGL